MESSNVRHHIVLVPGFVGFDALGQIHYYAGVTDVFRTCSRGAAALHYFDNVPTASVALRADRLCSYLLNKHVRGEIAPQDRISLVGHSTGALDIRQALCMLHAPSSARTGSATETLLSQAPRLVFLSAPHFGKTLADPSRELSGLIQAAFGYAGLALSLNRDSLLHARALLLSAPATTELEKAVIDTLNECDARSHDGHEGHDGQQHIAEREARAELALWLEHIGRDFSIIEDLCSRPQLGSRSPAHFSAAQRGQELARWRARDVRTRSYVTRVSAAVKNDALVQAIVRAMRGARELSGLLTRLNRCGARLQLPHLSCSMLALRLLTFPPLLPALALLRRRPTLVFELFHALCADPELAFSAPAELCPSLQRLDAESCLPASSISHHDSDGVVNTQSMLWPYDPEHTAAHSHVLVEADHADIIGHYALRPSPRAHAQGRTYEAYDVFPSGAGFDAARFNAVWTDIFRFCTES